MPTTLRRRVRRRMLRLRKRLAERRPAPVASFQGLEQLEPRMMMSGVTAPVGYVPIESDIYISAELVPGLSSDELGRAASDTVLQQGVEYYVQATGRYMIHDANGNGLYDSGTDRWADAEFFQQQSAQNQNDRWVDHGLAPTPANAGAWGFRLGIDDGDPATADDTRQINFLNQYQNARQTGESPTYAHSFVADRTGVLQLRIQDSVWDDNSGGLTVDLYARPQIDSVTLYDARDSNKEVVDDAAGEDESQQDATLVVPLDGSGHAEISFYPTIGGAPVAMSAFAWEVTGGAVESVFGYSGDHGSFSDANSPLVLLAPEGTSEPTYTLTVGRDADGDGRPDEAMITTDIETVRLEGLVVRETDDQDNTAVSGTQDDWLRILHTPPLPPPPGDGIEMIDLSAAIQFTPLGALSLPADSLDWVRWEVADNDDGRALIEGDFTHGRWESAFLSFLAPDEGTRILNVNVGFDVDADGVLDASEADHEIEVRLTVVGTPDLTVYRPQYAKLGSLVVDPEDEADAETGAGIRINGRDGGASEDDLVRVDVVRGNADTPLYLRRSNDALRVWTSRIPSGDPIAFTNNLMTTRLNFDAGGVSQLWVEWSENQHGTGTIELMTQQGTVVDTIQLHTFRSTIVGLGGWTQRKRGAGTADAARLLIDQGYDAHWYSHGDWERGRDVVIQALRDEGVENVALFGHSLGGNRMHDLAADLAAEGYGDHIRYTVYIDAIDIRPFTQPIPPFTLSEQRKPPASPVHDSYYQRIDYRLDEVFLKGNETTQNLENLNATNYDGFFNCGYATSVTNCDVSDDLPPETVRESGAHIDIDQWSRLQRRYADRVIFHLGDC